MTKMSLRRLGRACCVSARPAGVVSVAALPVVSVMAVCVASEDIVEGVVRESL